VIATGDLRPVLPLRCLLRHIEQRADLGPASVGPTRRTHRLSELRIDFITPLHQLGDGPQSLCVSLLKSEDSTRSAHSSGALARSALDLLT
jgi:hypothetical protein